MGKLSKPAFAIAIYEQIAIAEDDPRELRALVYEATRNNLLKRFETERPENADELWHMLEAAIQDVEYNLSRSKPSSASTRPEISFVSEMKPASGAISREAVLEYQPGVRALRLNRRGALVSAVDVPWSRLVVAAVAIAFVGAGLVFWPAIRGDSEAILKSNSVEKIASSNSNVDLPPAPTSPPQTSAVIAEPSPPPFPLPSSFGVYAVNDHQLQEIKALLGKVPDRRVGVSAPITEPSVTNVSTGQLKFILFRPDLLQEAPTTSDVRVVAKVSFAMGVDSFGKASTTPVSESWVIRSRFFPFKIGPIENQPTMLLAQPVDETLVLAPGRYALVIKGVAYDFTVAGTITDPDQCVEKIQATNGAFYSPCPTR